MADEPLRTQTAFIMKHGLVDTGGTLLLYADRLSFVGSGGVGVGMLGGAAGMLIAGKLARNKAAGREADGGKGVTTIPLAEVTEVRRAKQGVKRNLLEVVRADGTAVAFGVNFHQWKPDVVAALTGIGRGVDDGGDVVAVS